MRLVAAAVAVVLGYLVGCVPIGILVARLRGVDPRHYGSGRTGGTNVWRATGSVPMAVAASLGDVVKGAVPVFVLRALFPGVPLAAALAGVAAVAGHNWSVYIRFGGGAGTTPNFGALFALSPPAFVVAFAAGAGVFAARRMASLASLAVSWTALAALLILAATDLDLNPFVARPSAIAQVVYGVGQAVLITYALLPNIRRLLGGEERTVEY
jgi:glycerol-3-phosphate acyltransferase PlsY